MAEYQNFEGFFYIAMAKKLKNWSFCRFNCSVHTKKFIDLQLSDKIVKKNLCFLREKALVRGELKNVVNPRNLER